MFSLSFGRSNQKLQNIKEWFPSYNIALHVCAFKDAYAQVQTKGFTFWQNLKKRKIRQWKNCMKLDAMLPRIIQDIFLCLCNSSCVLANYFVTNVFECCQFAIIL